MSSLIDKLWYRKHPLRWLLWPGAIVYQLFCTIRRVYLVRFCQQQFDIPIIVVGNLTVGGVGKTPLVIALAKKLREHGLRVGIVSRGYGAAIKDFPHEVNPHEAASLVGDEPLLLRKKTACPVVISPKRVHAVQYLIAKHRSQIIISDDGLQHYAMGRTIEIVVIDGLRKLGNGLCLPAGPLRESKGRLQKSDLLVVNGGEWPGAYSMILQPTAITHMLSGQEVSLSALTPPITAVAAIGHPQRFFNTLAALGLKVAHYYTFPDHYSFKQKNLDFAQKTLIMTEKDSVKCQAFAQDSWYFLSIEAQLDDLFWQKLWAQLQGCLR